MDRAQRTEEQRTQVGHLHCVQRDRAEMTDPIACPECHGRRGQLVGATFLACQFCGGRGWVGGDNEPAERGDEPPTSPGPAWEHKVWTDPAVATAIRCRYCLGARQVANVDECAGTIVMAACPVCMPNA